MTDYPVVISCIDFTKRPLLCQCTLLKGAMRSPESTECTVVMNRMIIAIDSKQLCIQVVHNHSYNIVDNNCI